MITLMQVALWILVPQISQSVRLPWEFSDTASVWTLWHTVVLSRKIFREDFHLSLTSSTTVLEHDPNMSAFPGAFWLLHQASLSCFLHQSAVKTWPCLTELECANRTQLWCIKISHMCIIHICFIYIYVHTRRYYISHIYYAAIDIFS